MSSDDTEYYRRRAVQERELALKAERAYVAALHLELAWQYDALVENAELRPRFVIVTPQRRSA
jgi:hypothetical protein